jgi:flagellar motor switch protein FliG
MEAYKKTALKLHSLSDADREWILGKLEATHREKLSAMLEELSSLGIPRQRDLMQTIDESIIDEPSHKPQTGPKKEKVPPGPLRDLIGARPEILQAILKSEPPAINAAVLLAYDWPWRQAVLEAFTDPVRQSVEKTMAQLKGRLTGKVNGAIIEVLAGKLCRIPEDSPEEKAGESKSERPARRWFFFWRK